MRRPPRRALWAMGLATASIVGCNAIFGLEELLPYEGTGGTGGVVATGGSGGEGGSAEGGAGVGGGGGGGGAGEPLLTCSIDPVATQLMVSGEGNLRRWTDSVYVVPEDPDKARAFVESEGGVQTVEVYSLDNTGFGTSPDFTFEVLRLQDARRIDASQVGILYSATTAQSSGLFIRQLSFGAQSAVETQLSHDDTFTTGDIDRLDAKFFPVGNGGGNVLGDIHWAATFTNQSDMQRRAVYGFYEGAPTMGFVYADPGLENTLDPQVMFHDGGATHVFSGDFPASRHFVLPDGQSVVVAPQPWPMVDPAHGAGAMARSADGTINVTGVVASTMGTFGLTRYVGKVPDGMLSTLDVTTLGVARQTVDETMVVGGVGARGTQEQWFGENLVHMGFPILGDESQLVLRIYHASAQQRADVSWSIVDDVGAPAGSIVKAVGFAPEQQQLFGAVTSSLLAVVVTDAGTFDEIYGVRIVCAPD